MTEKVKYWWSEDRKWFCIIANGGGVSATVSLTPSEAAELGAEAIAPPAGDCDCGAEATGRWAGIHGPGCATLRKAENTRERNYGTAG